MNGKLGDGILHDVFHGLTLALLFLLVPQNIPKQVDDTRAAEGAKLAQGETLRDQTNATERLLALGNKTRGGTSYDPRPRRNMVAFETPLNRQGKCL